MLKRRPSYWITWNSYLYALISVKPIAVTIIVEGTPNLRWDQKVRLYPKFWERRACSQTIRLAADPSSERFPATVLTHANISHAFFSFSGDIVAAAAATLAPSNSTEKKKKKSPTILEVAKWAGLTNRSWFGSKWFKTVGRVD